MLVSFSFPCVCSYCEDMHILIAGKIEGERARVGCIVYTCMQYIHTYALVHTHTHACVHVSLPSIGVHRACAHAIRAAES